MKKNIVLIGFMGSGKSSVGIKLAKALDYQFIDTDAYIEEKSGSSIAKIFQDQGESYFRDLESSCLLDLGRTRDRCVISTGGGMPLREENAKLLAKLGHVVFLKASEKVIYERLKEDESRPLLQGSNPRGKIKELLEFRTPIYEGVAHSIISTDHQSFYQIIKSIMDGLPSHFL